MARISLDHIFKLVSGQWLDDDDTDALFKEALFVVLSRATVADTHICPVEVATVRRIYENHTGDRVSERDIRTTAIAKQYESGRFSRFMHRVGGTLDKDRRIEIAAALAEVIRADGNISPYECDFFNNAVKAFHLSPADVQFGGTA